MMVAKLAVLTALALLGSVSCQGGYGYGSGSGSSYGYSGSNGGAAVASDGGGRGGGGGGGSSKPTPQPQSSIAKSPPTSSPTTPVPPAYPTMSPLATSSPPAMSPPSIPQPPTSSSISPLPLPKLPPASPPMSTPSTPQPPTGTPMSPPPTPQPPTGPPLIPQPHTTNSPMSPPPTLQPPTSTPMSPPSTPKSPTSPPTSPPPTPQPPTNPPSTLQPPRSPPTSSPSIPQPPMSPPSTSQSPTSPSTSSSSIPQPSTSSPTSSPPTLQPPTSSPTSLPPTVQPQSNPPPTLQSPTSSPTSSPSIPQPPSSAPTSPPALDAGRKLRVGYYSGKCAHYIDVEAIVRKHVSQVDAGIKAGLIRLFFHDCFVRGCDASVLLDPTTANPQPEKLGVPNFPSLRGFEVIDAAKAELEAACPGTVSCADIVAFAARDASSLLSRGWVSFAMPAGRYDGSVSLAAETIPNLPPPFADAAQLKQMFAAKGLDPADMVTLSGAHSVGRSHCSSFSGRLAPPSNAAGSDMDPALAARLKDACVPTANNGTDGSTVAQDYGTPDELDSQFYRNVLDRKVLYASDAALDAAGTASLVRFYADMPWAWQLRFGQAMVKMGRVEVKTAANGEIRKACRFVNSNS